MQHYAALRGFAVDCFNPESVTMPTFQYAHADDTGESIELRGVTSG
jgi:hypothetical protein